MILRVEFGETHAVTHSIENDPEHPGAVYIETACGYKQTVTHANAGRFHLSHAGGYVGCYICRDKMGLLTEDD